MPRPLRTLALSVDIGAGHRSAADAVGEAIEALRPGSALHIVEALDHLGPGAGRLARELYFGVLEEVPDLWGWIYGGRGAIDLVRPLSEFVDELRTSDLGRLLQAERPDLVLAMHPLACGLAAALARTSRVDCPLAAVLTDMDAHPAWVARGLNMYLAPTRPAAEALQARGVHGARVEATGIPLRQGFEAMASLDPTLARQELGLDTGRLTLLVLGGGLGLGPLLETTRQLCSLSGPVQVMLICGGNQDLERDARALVGRTRAPLHVFGMVRRIWRQMAAADLAVSKPGGLTSAELMAAGVPLVCLEPIPGQEQANLQQLAAQGAAVGASSPAAALDQVQGLLADPSRLARMTAAARALGRPASGKAAARAALDMVERWPAEELRQRRAAAAPDLLADMGAAASDALRTVGDGIDAVGKELEGLLFGKKRR